ncbi:MAG: MarR family transcriptional regulator [Melioribacteraceae bacterium]|nr:MarR family transcriptional regulator [Melioribacteraceae bacterium]MCF8265546.1 MarR family transcriptional regulator [Melioribacteraceae bacterium]MCF8413859.1 MarR family transcriptional regulator [Melioribacteraceae bacterium]MCF8432041.1 MarR family transcriptional regulator [Melioribacteraceae bacterium]
MDAKVINITQAEKLAELTCELARLCQEKDSHFASSFNLSPAEVKILKILKKHDRISVGDVSKYSSLTYGRITQIITNLEKKGLIVRSSDSPDKRSVTISISKRNIPFVENVTNACVNLHSRIIETMDESKVEKIISSLDELMSAMRTVNSE